MPHAAGSAQGTRRYAEFLAVKKRLPGSRKRAKSGLDPISEKEPRADLTPFLDFLNAFAERWVRSVKEECLSRLILFGERSLHIALNEYVAHYHEERNHQGKGNQILFPKDPNAPNQNTGAIVCKMRLNGLLKYYYRSKIPETDGFLPYFSSQPIDLAA